MSLSALDACKKRLRTESNALLKRFSCITAVYWLTTREEANGQWVIVSPY